VPLSARRKGVLAGIWYRNEAGTHTSEALGLLRRSGADDTCLAPYIAMARARGVAWAHVPAWRTTNTLYTET
jgi:hypothetical protein